MPEFRVPYGGRHLEFTLPRGEMLAPSTVPVAPDPQQAASEAIDHPVGRSLDEFRSARSAVIAVNDKTRPVPHDLLLPPLLRRLEALGLAPRQIRFLIAPGTHAPLRSEEYCHVIPADILRRYPVTCHDSADTESLVLVGTTSRGTPAWINREFVQADLRIVVGNIELHQFMGYSGGVKTAAIGLSCQATVNHNHAMMTDPRAEAGRYDDNPARQDIEEIGRMAGVHFAVNAILNESSELVRVVAGEPVAVMREGIPLVLGSFQVRIAAPFDLLIASPGGHPKDINLYQAQKALAHAVMAMREGGTVILVAACPEGTGSQVYEQWMQGMTSHARVIERFQREGYRVGPHKAFQISRDASRVRVLMVTEMPPEFVRRLLLTPCTSLQEAVEAALSDLPAEARIGVMPFANATIPCGNAQGSAK